MFWNQIFFQSKFYSYTASFRCLWVLLFACKYDCLCRLYDFVYTAHSGLSGAPAPRALTFALIVILILQIDTALSNVRSGSVGSFSFKVGLVMLKTILSLTMSSLMSLISLWLSASAQSEFCLCIQCLTLGASKLISLQNTFSWDCSASLFCQQFFHG